MAITIRKVSNKSELKKFIRFNYNLYKGNPYKVPELLQDMMDTLTPGKNPAHDFCDYACFMAFKGEELVGRVVAIVNRRVNEVWKQNVVRFGWIDFIDDEEVSKALIDAVEQFGRERNCKEIEGPLGFTDLDPEGMLIEGFEEYGTMATIYNYPYYPKHMEKMGFEKAADWIEFRMVVPEAVPDKMLRIAEIVKKKFGLHTVKLKNVKEVKKGQYGQRMFDLINEGYKDLFGFVPLTQKQIDQYIDTYLSLLNLEMVSLVEDEKGELIAVGITMGSMSQALRDAKGKLFPFGWWPLLKTLKFKHPDTVDLLLVAVKPEYQNKGVNSLLFTDMIPIFIKNGYTWCESNPELEDNAAVQKQWEYFERRQNKRRRCFKKTL